jgi:ABC-type bacteriocin/lantibiotic exporter with double-glycine peptidase domain
MRMQDTAANCGPASLSNALQAIGITRTQAECEELCKTSGTDGTSIRGFQTALKSLGLHRKPINERRWDVSLLLLLSYLHDGHAAVLSVDGGEHWVAAVGVIGDRVLIADPAENELVLSLAPDALKARWGNANRFYGVVL